VIGAKRVTDPDGTTWKVGRRWLPDWPRLRERRRTDGEGLSVADLGDAGFDDALGVALVVVGIVLVLLLLTTVIFPVLVLTLELLIALVLLVGGITGRLLFRRPWTIRARSEHRELTWQATGFRRSGRVRDEVASALALGDTRVKPREAQGALPA
jgi:hypothetical protein